MSELKNTIGAATTAAMRARDRRRVGALRLVNAEIKRVEVDERRELADADVLQVLTKMLKQRRDSLRQYRDAGRDDLADQEQFEIDLIDEFMPQAATDAAIAQAIDAAVASVGATSMRDMRKVMGALRGSLQGRADMGRVSALVKERLAN
ncbi:MAG: GatB/YqeY domain-containing protein [Gammaproteobacteria bacterium]|nr:GatB/YqeY domain-containing protein [Gammaproteobacteria bacterium]